MAGAVIIILTLVVVIPVSVMVTGGVLAGVISYFLKEEADKAHPGSEFIDLNG